MFEGDGSQARQYSKWYIKEDRGTYIDTRNTKSFYAPVMRQGKTARDAASGAPSRSTAGRAARTAYSQALAAASATRSRSGASFPWDHCNGRETRALRAAALRRPKGDKKR